MLDAHGTFSVFVKYGMIQMDVNEDSERNESGTVSHDQRTSIPKNRPAGLSKNADNELSAGPTSALPAMTLFPYPDLTLILFRTRHF